ncbi:MAG: VOC family protein [Deltaproteobacteria bacterium]|nr:MAG: VOC family protein [Deltaproteobacteria bacterium]TMA63524.1 MAG: VOC family protein [Deltaproteobacteria bacterium]TMB40699.1 MAG: VOC family protein [Deltaproteobacteria bacterium]
MTNLSPYLCCKDATRAIEFYRKAFGAKETMRLAEPSGRIGHAELEIAGAPVMLADEYPDFGILSPTSIGGTPVKLHLYVDDVDALVARAVAAGAKVVRAVEDQFYGDRSGQIEDPFGHVWFVATRKEHLSTAEIQRRYDKLMGK